MTATPGARRPEEPDGRAIEEGTDFEGERLQKVLARAGIASRRAAEELIAGGRVTVNGAVASLGRRVDVAHDRVAVDGAPLTVRPGQVYYLLNKPEGVVTTASDPEGRRTVVQLVPSEPRVFPVGRLDAGTEGLLLLTNDGDLTHHLTHPRFGVDKEYLAHVEGQPSPADVRRLREGVELEDGRTSPARVALVAPDMLRIVIHEGRNRQVRRMCEAVGHPVLRLVRTRIGPLTDRRLAPGEWRPLTAAELRGLSEAAAAPGVPSTPSRSRARSRSRSRSQSRSQSR
ncbi:MAG: rRNA synthase [Acidimicrobiaceae bacterium]|nr:rRNA synthase [Acidimicrobiaceae bacterium]MDQ1415035.1 rRNA synthase [Acidimicrobiaceae bacterium]